MRSWLAIVLVLGSFGGCRSGDRHTAPATKSAVSDPWEVDPWFVQSSSDAPPSLAERKRLADEACPRVAAPHFYRVEKDGKVSHILGTRHVGVPLAKFPPVVHTALGSARLAVFEVAPDDDADSDDEQLDLRDELGPKLWARYSSLVGAAQAERLERAAPSVAILAMIIIYEDISAALDVEIQQKVLAANIPTRGLETSAFQQTLLAQLLDLRLLRASIEQTEDRAELAKESREDIAEYCAGTDDTPGMDPDQRRELLASGYSPAELDRFDELMVFQRNADWIPELEPILAAGDAFIAVGADHLTGQRGVIALLAARGYTATRVK